MTLLEGKKILKNIYFGHDAAPLRRTVKVNELFFEALILNICYTRHWTLSWETKRKGSDIR